MTKVPPVVALVSLLAAAWAPALRAQVRVTSHALELAVNGRLHTQFHTTSVNGERASDFLIRRARLEIGVRVSDFVSGVIQPDFGEGDVELKDAYVRLAFSPQFQVRVGQFKRPFDLFGLANSNEILVIERDGDVRGVDTCAGVGGLCAFSRFTEALQFAERDIGVRVEGASRDGRFGYMAALTNGAGANRADENGRRSVSGRVTYVLQEGIQFGANLGLHDYPTAFDTEYAWAFGGDVEYGTYGEQGVHVQGGLVVGDNWRNLVAGEPTTFVTLQGIVAYRRALRGGGRIQAIEPVGRLSWGNPDTGVTDDEGVLLTPGFVIHFTNLSKIATNLDVWAPSAGATEVSLKVQTYLIF